jgi:hypothetical protein
MNWQNEPHNEDIDPELVKLFELLRATPAREPLSIVQGEERFLAELDGLTSSFNFLGLRIPYAKASSNTAAMGVKKHNGFKVHPEQFPEEDLSFSPKRFLALWETLSASLFSWLTNLVSSGRGNQPSNFVRRAVLASILAVMLLVFGGAGFATAARSALPGEALYPLKTSLEQARISVAANPATQANLYLSLAENRLQEISGLVATGRYDQVAPIAAEFERYVKKAVAAVEAVAENDPAQAAKLNARLASALSSFAQSLGDLLEGAPETLRPDLQTAVETSRRALDHELSIPGEGSGEEQGIQIDGQGGIEKDEELKAPTNPTPESMDAPANTEQNDQKNSQDGCQDNNGDGADDQNNTPCEKHDGIESGIDQPKDEGKSDGQEYEPENHSDPSGGEDIHSDGESSGGDAEDPEHDDGGSGSESEGFEPSYGWVAQGLIISQEV